MMQYVELMGEFQSTPPRGGRPGKGQVGPRPVFVSIHAPARGATPPRQRSWDHRQGFNPRPRAGGDSSWVGPVTVHGGVSIHAPARGATREQDELAGEVARFQSTPPRGGRRARQNGPRGPQKFQSTPPRGGRPTTRQILSSLAHVSIHAPARGATSNDGHVLGLVGSFQSTPPRGGRRLRAGTNLELSEVSIHAPARGATPQPRGYAHSGRGFNPRPRAGGDQFRDGSVMVWVPFQSTPPRGGRHGTANEVGRHQRVSIHAPARGATTSMVRWPMASMFQSTPPRGGRRALSIQPCKSPTCFNPRPRAGGDRRMSRDRAMSPRFNPRPRAGGDFRQPFFYVERRLFQSTPPRGGRPVQLACARAGLTVSIHAPARGATSGRRSVSGWCAVSIHAPARGATPAVRPFP